MRHRYRDEFDEAVEELTKLTDEMVEAGLVKRDGSQYLYDLLIQRGMMREEKKRAKESIKNSNEK